MRGFFAINGRVFDGARRAGSLAGFAGLAGLFARPCAVDSLTVCFSADAGLIAAHPVVTLLYAARDTTCNNAEALRLWLEAGAGGC